MSSTEIANRMLARFPDSRREHGEALIQVGIRTMNPHQKKQAEKYEVQVLEMEKLPVVRPDSNARVRFTFHSMWMRWIRRLLPAFRTANPEA